MRKYVYDQKGFTMIEMMIVMLVITVILLVALPNVTKHSTAINDKGCRALVQMVQGQVQAYQMNHKTKPASIQALIDEGYLKSDDAKCPNGNVIVIDSEGEVSEAVESI